MPGPDFVRLRDDGLAVVRRVGLSRPVAAVSEAPAREVRTRTGSGSPVSHRWAPNRPRGRGFLTGTSRTVGLHLPAPVARPGRSAVAADGQRTPGRVRPSYPDGAWVTARISRVTCCPGGGRRRHRKPCVEVFGSTEDFDTGPGRVGSGPTRRAVDVRRPGAERPGPPRPGARRSGGGPAAAGAVLPGRLGAAWVVHGVVRGHRIPAPGAGAPSRCSTSARRPASLPGCVGHPP